eukprot:CAMPEP_0184972374 /NCGR_PEP_ID=MMETSP1098-20130426/4387_1 /TAXON_ID=89044 /ORGANISM="Spumella elongata, Strain CCAP 955/1" /LENGTH=81 /DNA_ID=CAMNT_0027494649 /DNA_START=6 /DNA_END=247 /DNA_ORIENTATION=-
MSAFVVQHGASRKGFTGRTGRKQARVEVISSQRRRTGPWGRHAAYLWSAVAEELQHRVDSNHSTPYRKLRLSADADTRFYA